MNTKRYNFSFKLFYLLYLGAIGAFVPYVNVYLENSRGLSGTQIGLLTSLSSLVGVLIIPLWGVAGDKTQKYTFLLRVSLLTSLVVLYFYRVAAIYPMIVLCAIMLEMTRSGTIPMADTLATNYCHKTNGNYGSIRGMGSLGYMLASVLVGFLADHLGLDGPLFATYAFLLIASFVVALGFPKEKDLLDPKDETHNTSHSFKQLFENKKFLFILITTLLSVTVVEAAMAFGGNHLVTTLQQPQSTISWFMMITVLPEFFFLMIAIKVIHKIGFKNYYLLAIGSMILRFSVYSLIPNPSIYLFISIVHCLGVGLMTVGNLTFIRNTVNPAILATAITILNAMLSIGRAVLGYFYGLLYELFSSFAIFQVSLIFFIIAFILVLKTKNFDHLEDAS